MLTSLDFPLDPQFVPTRPPPSDMFGQSGVLHFTKIFLFYREIHDSSSFRKICYFLRKFLNKYMECMLMPT